VGIELESPQGTCNGTIQGVAYFAAPDKFGVFVALHSMQPQLVPGSPRSSPKLLVATPGAHPKEKQ
jgi:dynactin complex subunit